MEISNAIPVSEREAILANPGFGAHFTDHMVRIDWTSDGQARTLVARSFSTMSSAAWGSKRSRQLSSSNELQAFAIVPD